MGRNRGFTLIELIITLGLIGIFLSMAFSPFIFSYKNFSNQNTNAEDIAVARRAMDYLVREIRKSDSIEVGEGDAGGGFAKELIIDGCTYEIIDRSLCKDGEEFIKGIDELRVREIMDEDEGIGMEINIVIKNGKGEDYILSSTVYIRGGGEQFVEDD